MRKNVAIYTLNKNYIIGMVSFKFRTISAYCRYKGYSRANFYTILNKPHMSKNVPTVVALKNDLDLDEALMWEDE